MRSWFLIDFFAAFPFELLEPADKDEDEMVSFRAMTLSDMNNLLKLPRVYRILRLARLIKMISKTKNSKYMQKLQEMFKLNSGIISVFNFLIISSIAINFMGCFWYFMAKIRGFEDGTWVKE